MMPDSPTSSPAPSPTSSPAPSPTLGAPRWMLWLPLVLFAGFTALVVAGLVRPARTDVPSRMIGQPLADFTVRAAMPDQPGLARRDLMTGKPHLLNFFASWCLPCIAEAPVLMQLHRQGVEIDGIAVRDHQADLAAYLAGHGNPYTRLGADDISSVQLAVGSSGVPETFVIDGHGIIRYQHIGGILPQDVPMMLAKLKAAGQ